MKAILHTQYGAPDLLQLTEVDKPAPKDSEVLIAIHATTVSTADCNMRNFTFVTRSMLPFAKLSAVTQKRTILDECRSEAVAPGRLIGMVLRSSKG